MSAQPSADLRCHRPLSVYVPSYRADRHWWPTILEPLSSRFGEPDPSDYQRRAAGKWVESGGQLLQPCDPMSADVAVLPFGLHASLELRDLYQVAAGLAAEARRCDLNMLVFCEGDEPIPAPGPNCIMFRTSTDQSRLAPTDVPLPPPVEDPAEVISLRRRGWSPRPSVNFVGQAYPFGAEFPSAAAASAKWTKAIARMGLTSVGLAGRLRFPALHFHRPAAVYALSHAREVHAQVRLRPSLTRLDMGREQDREYHVEFLSAIVDSDYTLAPRGMGNFSYRLYESLACGRPAILVESDMGLPCRSDVPWDTVTMKLTPLELIRLGHNVRKRHAMPPERWLELQDLCRRCWAEFLSMNGFYTRLVRNLTIALDEGAVDSHTLARAVR